MSVKSKAELKDLVRRELLEAQKNYRLNPGVKRGIPGPIFAERLEEKDTRRIRKAIIELIDINDMAIIGSSAEGYFIAETPEECEDALETLMSYLVKTGYHHKILLRASKKVLVPEQLKLGLEVR